MLFLIISLTPVIAISSNDITFSTSSSIDTHIKTGESFSATIDNPGSQVFIETPDGDIPCSCDTDFSVCECYFSGFSTAGDKEIKFKINESGANETTKELIADKSPPEVDVSVAIDGYDININYSVLDKLSNESSDCSGIQKIEIYVDNYLEYVKELVPVKNDCNFSESVKITTEPIEDFHVSVRAVDGAGNDNEQDSDNLNMDTESPYIEDFFELMQEEKSLEKIFLNSPQTPIVNVVVRITDANLVNIIQGNLLALNSVPVQNHGYNQKIGTCSVESGDTYKCVFRNIALHPNDNTISLNITAQDHQGNIVTREISREFPLITSSNEIIHIGPDQENNCDNNNKCYINQNALLEVIIVSEDSSFNQMHIPLKISQISNNDINFANPFKCEQENENWICYYSVSVGKEYNSTTKRVYIDNTASDDYGKGMTGLSKNNLVIDMTEPKIKEDTFEKLVNGEQPLDYCLKTGDTLTINFDATDDLSTELKISAYTNATSDHTFYNDCEKEGDKFLCSLEMTNFLNSEAEEKPMIISVQDLAGNKKDKVFNVSLCVADLETVPGLVSSLTVNSAYNSFVDRRVASFRYWKQYIPLKITQFGPNNEQNNIKITHYEIDNCIAYDADVGADYIYSYDDSYYFIDDSQGQSNADAIVYIGGRAIEVDDVDLVCTVKFYGRIGNTYYVKPQIVNFTARLDFEGINIAGPDAEIQKEIDELKDDVEDLNSDMKWRKTTQLILGTICNIAETMATVNGVIQAVNSLLYLTAQVFKFLKPLFTPFFKIADGYNKFVNTYIYPAGNPISFTIVLANKGLIPPGSYLKSACWIYKCKFYDVNEVFNGFVQGFQGDVAWDGPETDEAETDEAEADGDGPTDTPTDGGGPTDTPTDGTDFFAHSHLNDYQLGGTPSIPSTYSLTSNDETTTTGAVTSTAPAEDVPYVSNDGIDQYYSAVAEASGGAWIINPYKSEEIDGLCLEASLFNMEKRRQITCMQIKCLQEAKAAGYGVDYCQEIFELRECLYLTGANYKTAGSFGNLMLRNLPQVVYSIALGGAKQTAMQMLCEDKYSIYGIGALDSFMPDWGGIDVICGVLTSFQAIQTIISSTSEEGMENAAAVFGPNFDLGDECEDLDLSD